MQALQRVHDLVMCRNILKKVAEKQGFSDSAGGQEVAGSSPVAPIGWKTILHKQFGYPPAYGGAFGNPI